MNAPSLDTVLDNYEQSVALLGNSSAPVTEETAIKILKARDIVARTTAKDIDLSFEQQKKLVTLDKNIREKAWQISQSLDLPAWRNSFKPPDTAWWWYLDKDAKHPHWDQLDWLWRGLTVVGWTVNLALLIDTIPRFFIGGTGFGGAVAIAFPSLLTLLQANSELTKTGKEGFNKLLQRWKIPQYFHAEAQLGSTVFLTIVLIGLRLALPTFSDMARQDGFENEENKQIAQAKAYYEQALALDPDNTKARYNLGSVYEDLQQLDKAKTQYVLSIESGYPKAYNNLARLYILENKPNLAVPLLIQGLDELKKLETLPESELASNVNLKYNILKNLGWAFLQADGEKEAEESLQIAIQLSRSAEGIEQIHNRASAHCLLAQVYEKNNSSGALEQWKQCYKLGSNSNPDEVKWIILARQKIEEGN